MSSIAVPAVRPARPQQLDSIAVAKLRTFIEHERSAKQIPAISIAIVRDQQTVYEDGFGFADSAKLVPATAHTVYRVGSVSKLFTALAVMKLAEQQRVNIDTPIVQYLPSFHPTNPFPQSITLRHVLSHSSGLPREAPVGSYFDASAPSLQAAVASLNGVATLFEPGKGSKYSNAGMAVAGAVVERVEGKPVDQIVQEQILQPLNLTSTSFSPAPSLLQRLARGTMWRYDGVETSAPAFRLGTVPSINLFSTVHDLAEFARMLLNDGATQSGRIVSAATLERMWTPSGVAGAAASGHGLGFFIGDFNGYKTVGHTGAVYGYSTTFLAVPGLKLAVAVASSIDVGNVITDRIANYALALLLAQQRGAVLNDESVTKQIPASVRNELPGYYSGPERSSLMVKRKNSIVLQSRSFRSEVRAIGDTLILDDRVNWGPAFRSSQRALTVASETLKKTEGIKPPPIPEQWRGLIGEYGWDHSTLYVFEMWGRLYALLENFEFNELIETAKDEYALPDNTMFAGERIVFTRNAIGRAVEADLSGIVFPGKRLDGESGETFKIKPLKGINELRALALAAKPPVEKNDMLKSDLVELAPLDPTIKFDVRYASTNNFMSERFYSEPRAFLQRSAAEGLLRAQRWLQDRGYGLLIHDAYRPWLVTKMFWEATPEPQRIFVADPSKGSRHNRGCAVDLTLYDLASGQPVEMVSGYDEFSDRAFPDYIGGTSLQRWHRELLRTAMESNGFDVYDWEWWHFDFQGWERYPIGTKTFEELSPAKRSHK